MRLSLKQLRNRLNQHTLDGATYCEECGGAVSTPQTRREALLDGYRQSVQRNGLYR